MALVAVLVVVQAAALVVALVVLWCWPRWLLVAVSMPPGHQSLLHSRKPNTESIQACEKRT